jgi:hypothetical protein
MISAGNTKHYFSLYSCSSLPLLFRFTRRNFTLISALHAWNWRIFSYMDKFRYGMDDWGSRVRYPAGAGNFSLHHPVQNSSGAHPALLSNGYWGPIPWGLSGRGVKLAT